MTKNTHASAAFALSLAFVPAIAAADTSATGSPIEARSLDAVLACDDPTVWRRFADHAHPALAPALKQGIIEPMAFVAKDTSPVQYRYLRPLSARGLTIQGFSSQFGLMVAPTLYVREGVADIRRILGAQGADFVCAAHGGPGGVGCESKVKEVDDPAHGQTLALTLVLYQDRAAIPTGETLVACVGQPRRKQR